MKRLISRRTFIIGGIGLLLSYLYFDLHSIAVKKYTIAIHNLPKDFEGFTILHLTDLHSKEFGDKQDKLLKLINRQSFDIVAITGDFIDEQNPDVEPTLSLVRGLSPKSIFFVPGNHERSHEFRNKSELEASGVEILENKRRKYSKGSSHIWILGVDDPSRRMDNLNQALVGITDSQPRILLAHAPNIFMPAAKSNIDLVLVGHTHGGQVRLPIIGAIVAPGQGLFPKYDYGQFKSGSTNMIISSGLGESILPIRFYNRPEIVLVKLVSSN